MVTTYKQVRRKNEVKQPTPPDAVSHEKGLVHALDVWSRLRRFLVLGSAVGSYYVGAEALTEKNTEVIEEALRSSPPMALAMMQTVGESFVAPKHDPVLYALAVAAGFDYGSMERNKLYRSQAYNVATEVCRTWTHVSHFLTYRSEAGISGRGQRRFIRLWYTKQSPHSVTYQAIKYPSRDGWAQRDALILARPKPPTPVHNAVFRYLVTGELPPLEVDAVRNLHEFVPVYGREVLHGEPRPTPFEAASIITRYRLPREAVPTDLLNSPQVWEALLHDMPLTAMLRNLNKMTAVNLLVPGSNNTVRVIEKLSVEHVRGSRVHPFTILTALKQYQQGRGERGGLRWTPVPEIMWALDAAFYMAFKNVTPTGKRILLGLDVSSSMDAPAGNTGMSCREVEAVMALVTLNVEERADVIGYTDRVYDLRGMVRPNMAVMEMVKLIESHPAGWTNCAAPIQWAEKHGRDYDAFVNYTDNETNDRPGNVARVLHGYRTDRVGDARHVVVAAAANGISVSDPNDPLSLDIAGFGSDVPAVIGEFVSGRL